LSVQTAPVFRSSAPLSSQSIITIFTTFALPIQPLYFTLISSFSHADNTPPGSPTSQ
jgi:hypothetical protein